MREQGFGGNCDSQGKLGMCPNLAEPDSDGFPRRSVFNHKPQAKKSFLIQQFFKNVGEVWASSPDRCPQAAKFLCHAFGTRRGW